MPSEAQNRAASDKVQSEKQAAATEKIVSLNEDSKSHEHDEASFNKLYAAQQERMKK